MSKFKFGIVTRAWMLLGFVSLILIFSIGFNIFITTEVESLSKQFFEKDDLFQQKTTKLELSVTQVQQWLTDISATRGLDGLNDGFDEAEKYAKKSLELIDELARLDTGNSGFYSEMKSHFNHYYNTGKKMAQLYIDQGPAGGNPFMSTFDDAAAGMLEQLEHLMKMADSNKSTVSKSLLLAIDEVTLVSIIGSIVTAIILAIGIFYLIAKLKPLENIRDATERLAANDLRSEVELVEGNHEIAALSVSFNHMKESLSCAISHISDVADKVNNASKDMTLAVDQTHSGVSRQHNEIEQIATAIHQMANTVQEISQNTVAASDASDTAEKAVINGSTMIKETTDATQNLADKITHGAEVIIRLKNESENIGSVLDVIRGIAEQTNLLALNAAIEAARAGDQGRGFAVVADEVRTLASRTQQSTNEIQGMIEGLQAGSSNAVAVFEESRDQAEKTTSLAEKANESLKVIRESVQTINEMSTQIATATEEQGVAAGEISRNVQGIHDISQETASAAELTADASRQLTEQAIDLHDFVSKFTV